MLMDKSIPLLDFQMDFCPETSVKYSQEVLSEIEFVSVKFSHRLGQEFGILDNYQPFNENI